MIGAVTDLRSTQLDAPPEPEVFTPYAQAVPFADTFVLRTTVNPTALASAIRASLVAIDRAQDVAEVTTLEQALAESIAPRRCTVLLFGTFAGAALLLACIGVYGLIAYSIAQRHHECGVCIALSWLGSSRRWWSPGYWRVWCTTSYRRIQRRSRASLACSAWRRWRPR